MCTNALVDSLECYMDDLVDCFEDFIKKSLILITVAVGAVVAIFLYLMKIITERSEELRIPLSHSETTRRISRPSNAIRVSDTSIQSKSLHDIMGTKKRRKTSSNDYTMYQDNQVKNTSTSISKVPTLTTMKSSDESILNKSQITTSNVPRCDQGSACNPMNSKPNDSVMKQTNNESRMEISSIKTLVAIQPCDDCASKSSWKNSIMRSLSAPRMMARFDSANCMPRHHLSAPRPCSRHIPVRTSCCSMCCADDDRR